MTAYLRAKLGRLGSIGVHQTAARHALSAFTHWSANQPVDAEGSFGHLSVRYQVARYCEYLDANPWPDGDPLRDARQRTRVVEAYAAYLKTFDTPAQTISHVRKSLDRFYSFLGTASG